MAVMTNYHTLSSWKQHKIIILEFCMSEVQNGHHWAKIKVLAGLIPSGGSRGEPLSLPLLPSRAGPPP